MLDPERRAIRPFLAENAGLESGLMIVQYSCALGELYWHSTPRSAFQPPLAGQKDHEHGLRCWNLFEVTALF